MTLGLNAKESCVVIHSQHCLRIDVKVADKTPLRAAYRSAISVHLTGP